MKPLADHRRRPELIRPLSGGCGSHGSAAHGRLAIVGNWLRDHAGALRLLQWLVVLVYAALLLIPAWLPLPGDSARIVNNLTIFAQFVFWGIWWPFVLLSMVLFGRLWCGVLCPEGALSEWAAKKGWADRFRAGCAGTAGPLLLCPYHPVRPAGQRLPIPQGGAVGAGWLYRGGHRRGPGVYPWQARLVSSSVSGKWRVFSAVQAGAHALQGG
jgi:hypothetical protein